MLDLYVNIPARPLVEPLEGVDEDITISEIGYICKVYGREGEEDTYHLVKKGLVTTIFTISEAIYLRLRDDICINRSSEWVSIISYSPSLMHHKNVHELIMPVELIHSVRVKVFRNLVTTFAAKVWTTQYGTFFEEGLYRTVWCNSIPSPDNKDGQIGN